MSKKLDSILSKVPPAMVEKESLQATGINNKITIPTIELEKTERMVAVVPYSLKQSVRRYLAENPEETERTLIMRGLKALGFEVNLKELKDKRGKSHKEL
jgi:hypothetical protein